MTAHVHNTSYILIYQDVTHEIVCRKAIEGVNGENKIGDFYSLWFSLSHE